jgi:4-hydroxy-3-methylbut-2-enyl diphosphate reductase
MGQSQSGMYLVENVPDVATLNVSNPDQLAYVTQTTLSVDDASSIVNALKVRFPLIVGPKKDDICYATQNRQDAIKQLAMRCGVIVVVGSKNSSNSNRLREVAGQVGAKAYLVDRAAEIDSNWFTRGTSIGVSAGASAPESLVIEVVEAIAKMTGGNTPETLRVDEGVSFPLPPQLAR